ncbi:hypothetical protein ILYODFUR_020702 [Ilyodon furcidens]|uniref:Uncharacterized protein n=1 Tax=Ilyodon furcidens TaxID=33524 RepID=A0ABV0VFN2_9TELE
MQRFAAGETARSGRRTAMPLRRSSAETDGKAADACGRQIGVHCKLERQRVRVERREGNWSESRQCEQRGRVSVPRTIRRNGAAVPSAVLQLQRAVTALLLLNPSSCGVSGEFTHVWPSVGCL